MKTKLLLTAFLFLTSFSLWSATFQVDGITYQLIYNVGPDVEVTYNGTGFSSSFYSGDIIIPETVTYEGKTYKVARIGYNAFYGCKDLTSIEIPNSVEIICSSAFWRCTGLTSIKIPDSVTRIQNLSFSGCSALTSVELPSNLVSIEAAAFEYCSALTSIDLPVSLTSIGYGAFDGCSLTSIEIPNNVISIGTRAFSLSTLEEIKVDSNNPVYRMSGNCLMEGNIVIAAINNPVIPEDAEAIGPSAFYCCNGLTSVKIPNSVTSIGENAFFGCSELMSVNIPNGITRIEDNTFEGCYALTSVEIPNSVTMIGNRAFYGCSRLSSIEIPHRVTSIGSMAFRDCCNLKSVTCMQSSMPRTGANVFDPVTVENAVLCVPKSCIAQYATAAPWSTFKSFNVIDTGDIDIEESEPILFGDFNNDGQITASDISHLVNIALGKESPLHVYYKGGIMLSHGKCRSLWKNDSPYLGYTDWSSVYNFSNEENATVESCYAFSSEDWELLKTQEFKMVIEVENPRIRICSGWWTCYLTEDDIYGYDERLEDNGDGTMTLTVNLAGSPLLDVIDEQHLLFTGEGYKVIEIYVEV